MPDPKIVSALDPELFVPNTDTALPGSWALQNSPRRQPLYPFMFVLPSGNLFYAGPEDVTYRYRRNVVPPVWEQLPPGSSFFKGGSAVMYRPGEIMKSGHLDNAPPIGTTAKIKIDANDVSAAGWVPSANGLKPRIYHNQTVLPTGKVLATGGTSNFDATVDEPGIRQPELWNPDGGPSGQGGWYGGDTLAADPAKRGHHSTVLILPDGRLVSAGGDTRTNNAAYFNMMTIFCPPYLFKTDGTVATRPAIGSVPERVRYGNSFSICMPDPTPGTISTVCLIRPGAVTHSFNQDQRYVPLTFAQTQGRLTVIAPADSFIAPPGDYLLFIVNNQGVPAVARWVRVGSVWSSTDATAPSPISEVHGDYVTTNGINLVGTMSGDDAMSGTALYVDVRYSLSPILNETAWASAQSAFPAPVAGCSGQSQSFPVSGLAPCHTYHFAVKFGDESGNWSALGDTASATTLCGGCCGGEVRAALARDGEQLPANGDRGQGAAPAGDARAAGSFAGATSASGAANLVIAAVPGPAGLDLELIAVEDVPTGGDFTPGGGSVVHQRLGTPGAWATRLQYDPLPGDRFALCAPERPTRWVFLEPFALEKVLPVVGGSAGGWAMDRARHSREGDVTNALAALDSPPALVPGDTLRVHYSTPSLEASGTAPSWLLVIDRPTSAAAPTRAVGRQPVPGAGMPAAFALHQNLPNPFAEATSIRFALPVASRVRIEIYDLLGRRVRTLVNESYPPGEHQVEWNRRTAGGAIARPGLYFCRMDAGQYREKKRMVILP